MCPFCAVQILYILAHLLDWQRILCAAMLLMLAGHVWSEANLCEIL